jgi:hypothetical protein
MQKDKDKTFIYTKEKLHSRNGHILECELGLGF